NFASATVSFAPTRTEFSVTCAFAAPQTSNAAAVIAIALHMFFIEFSWSILIMIERVRAKSGRPARLHVESCCGISNNKVPAAAGPRAAGQPRGKRAMAELHGSGRAAAYRRNRQLVRAGAAHAGRQTGSDRRLGARAHAGRRVQTHARRRLRNRIAIRAHRHGTRSSAQIRAEHLRRSETRRVSNGAPG